MGLFSSKRKVGVAATSVPLMDREVNLLSESLMRSILRKRDISSGLVEDMVNAGGRNIVRAYSYAKSDYHFGLPNGTTEVLNYSEIDLIAAIEATTGDKVHTVNDVLRESGDPSIEANWYLDDTRGRILLTGNLTTLPSALTSQLNSSWNTWVATQEALLTTYRGAVERQYPQTVSSVVTGETDSSGNPCTKRIQDVLTVTAEHYQNSNQTSTTRVDDIDYPADNNGFPTGHAYTYRTRQHFALNGVVSYVVSTTRTVTPEYADSSQGTPYVEFFPDKRLTDRYPFSQSSDHIFTESTTLDSTYNFRSLKFYVQYALADGSVKSWMYDTSSNTYPDLNYTTAVGSESAFYPVVPLRYENKDYCHKDEWDTVRYLTSKKLLKIMGIDIQTLRDGINGNPNIDDVDHAYFMFGVQLQDESQSAKRYLCEFFAHMDSLLTAGQHGQSVRITEGGMNMRLAWDSVNTAIRSGHIGTKGKATTTTNAAINQMVFRLQFDEDSYKEVTVTGLRHINYIYEGQTVETTLADTLEEGEFNFIVPLHASVVQNLPTMVRNELYYDSMQLVFYSYEVTYVAWYQQKWFSDLIKVLAVVITIASLGSMANEGYALYTAAAAGGATALAGLSIAAQFVILEVLQGLLISHVFQLVVAQVNPEIAIIMAVALAAYGGYKGIKAGGIIEGSSAEMLLKLSTGINVGIQRNLAQSTQDLSNEVDAFSKDADEKMDALDEINKEFALEGIIDPMEFIMSEPMIHLNESPESYYFRTVHSGNIGAMSYDAITNYHNLMLDLPKPQHTYI